MYEKLYGLAEKPFSLVPDPRYLYLGESHREALAHLLYAIDQGEGFTQVVGQVGTGKTTLLRTLLERMDDETDIAFIFNPAPSAGQLLASINREFGLATSERSRSDLLHDLNLFLLDKKSKGRRVLLVIDEAHTLDNKVLEQVRLISNLETGREKLIQILLVGQPELDDKLALPELRQLRQRITIRWMLRPFGLRETGEYVRHRLRVAGCTRPIFTRRALRAIYYASGGVPRLVNAIADRALLMGYTEERPLLRAGVVRRSSRQLPAALRTGVFSWLGLSPLEAGALVVVGLLAGLGAPAAALLWQGGRVAPDAPGSPVAPAGDAPQERMLPPQVSSATPRSPVSLVRPDSIEPVQRFGRGRDESAASAFDSLLEAWGYAPLGEPELDPDLFVSAVAGSAPLRVLATTSSLDQIAGLDLPAIVELEVGPGQRRYAAVVGAGDGEFAIARPEGRFAIPFAQLEQFATGRAFIFWTNFESLPMLEPGMQGEAVVWVQRRLADLGYLSESEVSGEFDAVTGEAVRQLQTDHLLEPTGEVGPKTLIALYQALRYGAPRLRAAGEDGGDLS